jgi:membrane protease YdiL (CAAX protease family)
MRVVTESAVSTRPDPPPGRPWAAPLRLRGDDRAAILSREVLLVLGVSLGMSAIYSVVSPIAKLTAEQPLNQQTTSMNTPASSRPLLALVLELLQVVSTVLPALLALYLLNRDRDWSPGSLRVGGLLGLDRQRWRFDLASGFVLTLVIGVPGLGLYLLARELGFNTIVSAANLTEWWAGPVLVLLAAANGVIEEVVVVGYLITRLRQTGWGVAAAVTFSALLRGTYHLYQGFGGFVGNAVMGVIFALFFLRTRRLWPLILAHTLLDVVAFLGYTLLRDRLPWL